jgi:hypothetical protein
MWANVERERRSEHRPGRHPAPSCCERDALQTISFEIRPPETGSSLSPCVTAATEDI